MSAPYDLGPIKARIGGDDPAVTATDALTMVLEIETLRSDVRILREREATIVKALAPVSDGGQYRADIVSAIERTVKDRDDLRAALDESITVLARLVGSDHPRIVSFRALLPAVKP